MNTNNNTANQASDIDPKKREDNYTIAQNEGNTYDKEAPEEPSEKKSMGKTIAGNGDNDTDNEPEVPSQPEPDTQQNEKHHEETGPATPPEKTREAPKADK